MSNTRYNPEGFPWPLQGNDFSHPQQPFPYYQPQQQQMGSYPYTQQQMGSYPYAQQPIYQMYQPMAFQQNNDNGTISLVLGILSMVFAGPIGLILGIVGLVLANKARQLPIQSSLTNAGRICSIVGIVLSSFAFIFIVIYFIFIFAAFASM